MKTAIILAIIFAGLTSGADPGQTEAGLVPQKDPMPLLLAPADVNNFKLFVDINGAMKDRFNCDKIPPDDCREALKGVSDKQMADWAQKYGSERSFQGLVAGGPSLSSGKWKYSIGRTKKIEGLPFGVPQPKKGFEIRVKKTF